MQLFYDFGDQTQRICNWHNYHLDSKSSLINIIKPILELLKLMSIESLIPCCLLLLLPSLFPSIKVFSNESVLRSGGQSIEASSSASVLPVNIQGWFPLWLTGLICLQSRGLPRVFSNTTVWNHQFFNAQPSLQSNSHPFMTTGKTTALTIQTFVGKVMSLLFNMLSRFVMFFFQGASI